MRPIGSLYHHFPGGKTQIAREALLNAGVAYGLLIPTVIDPHDDLGDALEAVFVQAAEDMASTGFANMCPVGSVAGEVADTVEELRDDHRGHLHRPGSTAARPTSVRAACPKSMPATSRSS